jgi:hypothetical protein
MIWFLVSALTVVLGSIMFGDDASYVLSISYCADIVRPYTMGCVPERSLFDALKGFALP